MFSYNYHLCYFQSYTSFIYFDLYIYLSCYRCFSFIITIVVIYVFSYDYNPCFFLSYTSSPATNYMLPFLSSLEYFFLLFQCFSLFIALSLHIHHYFSLIVVFHAFHHECGDYLVHHVCPSVVYVSLITSTQT